MRLLLAIDGLVDVAHHVRVAAGQLQQIVVDNGAVDRLVGLGIKVAAHQHWPIVRHRMHEFQQVLQANPINYIKEVKNGKFNSIQTNFSLFVAQFGKQCAIARLQMRRADGELLAGFAHSQIGRDRHLIALDAPHFEDARLMADQIEFVGFVEDRAAVGPVVLVDVEAGRVWLRKENALIVLCAQYALQELEMVHFLRGQRIQCQLGVKFCISLMIYLQTNDVGIVLNDFLYDEIFARFPSKRFVRTAYEIVIALAERCTKEEANRVRCARLELLDLFPLRLIGLTLRKNVPLQDADLLGRRVGGHAAN